MWQAKLLKEHLMRKVLAWMSVFILIPLVACGFGGALASKQPAPTPVVSNEQLQTQVAQLQTQVSEPQVMMPTSTGQPAVDVTPTGALPTVAIETATVQSAAGGQTVPTVTPKPTEAAQAQPTATSTSSASGGQVATVTATTAAASAATATKPAAGPDAPLSQDNPGARMGKATGTDSMNNPDTWIWPTGSDDYSQAVFVNGKQSVKALTTKDGWRLANPKGRDFSNLYVETIFEVKDVCHQDAAGMADHYGIIVRVPELSFPTQGYLFGFNCNGQYSLRSWDWDGQDVRRQDMMMLIDWTTPKDKEGKNIIHSGTRTTNVMGMMTVGSKIRLYANGYYLAEYDHSTNTNIPHLPSGYFGVFVGSRTDTNFTIWVDEMSYWENPQP
jgi:hypothetical protein